MNDDGARLFRTRQFRAGHATTIKDAVAREEPLEIQIGTTSLAVVMRTPGDDEELVRGFLVTERIVARQEDVASIRPCSVAPTPEADGNVMRVELCDDVCVDFEALRRNLFASSSCGVCGKATIENAMAVAPALDDDACFAASYLATLPGALGRGQVVFSQTGGLHAAGLFAPDGQLLVTREDVGRHNAVDKVIGWAAANGGLPLGGHVLMVSGRISYEIVQKALAARIPLIAAVSAPSSLAVEMATKANMALVGFLREGDMNVYGATTRVSA